MTGETTIMMNIEALAAPEPGTIKPKDFDSFLARAGQIPGITK